MILVCKLYCIDVPQITQYMYDGSLGNIIVHNDALALQLKYDQRRDGNNAKIVFKVHGIDLLTTYNWLFIHKI